VNGRVGFGKIGFLFELRNFNGGNVKKGRRERRDLTSYL